MWPIKSFFLRILSKCNSTRVYIESVRWAVQGHRVEWDPQTSSEFLLRRPIWNLELKHIFLFIDSSIKIENPSKANFKSPMNCIWGYLKMVHCTEKHFRKISFLSQTIEWELQTGGIWFRKSDPDGRATQSLVLPKPQLMTQFYHVNLFLLSVSIFSNFQLSWKCFEKSEFLLPW